METKLSRKEDDGSIEVEMEWVLGIFLSGYQTTCSKFAGLLITIKIRHKKAKTFLQ